MVDRRRRRRWVWGVSISVVALIAVGGLVLSSIQHRALVRRYIERPAYETTIAVTPDRYATVPQPVQRYFRFAFGETESVAVRTVRWREEGDFQLPVGEFSVRSSQHSSAVGVAYVWRGVYRIAGWMPFLESRDAFSGAQHNMRAKILGYITVMDTDYADDRDVESLHEYLTLRYFGTAVTFPWALLPGESHHWEAENESQAWLVLNDASADARYLVTFAPSGEITRMETPGVMLHGNGSMLREVGTKGGYREVEGMMVATEMEYFWYTANEELDSWYHPRLTDIRYR